MSQCEQFRTMFSQHLDGELDEQAGRELRLHLERCRACRDELRILEEAVSRVKAHLSRLKLTTSAKQEIKDGVLDKIRQLRQ